MDISGRVSTVDELRDGVGIEHGQSPREPTGRGSGRSRVTRACDRCKKRKIRCTGLHPCEICERAETACTYNASYSRGRRALAGNGISSSGDGTAHLPARSDDFQYLLSGRATGRVADSGEGALRADGEQVPSLSTGEGAATSTESPEPTQTDLEGHYVGPASGLSFLIRVQKRLYGTVPVSNASSIFTFGDAPLPYFDPASDSPLSSYFDPTFFVLLSKEESTQLVQRYFDFTVPVDRFLHRPTVEQWLDEFYDTGGTMRDRIAAPAQRALLFMVFALAQQHLMPRPTPDVTDKSVRFFLSAHHQLAKERGPVRLTSVQARLCQCLWLLSESRINHCWSLFGSAAHLAFAIGLHRHRDADPMGGYGYIELEYRRRTFWSAYCLDNYLTTALGRPKTFRDEDIDQELPACCDDKDILFDRIMPRTSRELSLMHAPLAFFKLSHILSNILRDLYSIRPASSAERRAHAVKYTQRLNDWRADMHNFLDADASMAPLVSIFQRQRNVLNLAYWHTMIVTHRPFLLHKFAGIRHPSRPDNDERLEGQNDESVRQCLLAAMHIVNMVDEMSQADQMYRAFWFTTYFAFSAAAILYVCAIHRSKGPLEDYASYFLAATKCQDQIFKMAEKDSLAARYCLVLEELRVEALRIIDKRGSTVLLGQNEVFGNGQGNGSEALLAAADGSTIPDAAFNFPNTGIVDDLANYYVSPNNPLAEITSWRQFDSMVFQDAGGIEDSIGDDRRPPQL